MPVMSVYTSFILLGLHLVQAVPGSLHLPTYIQNEARDSASGLDYRQVTVLPLGRDLNLLAPPPRDLKPRKLLRRLGDDYNPFWMSLELPADMLHTHVGGRGRPATGQALDSVNLTMLEHSLLVKYGPGFVSKDMAKGIMDAVRSWLVETASCPVYYLWEDLGLLFWPRWVRRGFCSLQDSPLLNINSRPTPRAPASDCSWPPGMHCVPAKTKQLKILLWQCRNQAPVSGSGRPRLPGMAGISTSPNRSRRHRSDTWESQQANNRSRRHRSDTWESQQANNRSRRHRSDTWESQQANNRSRRHTSDTWESQQANNRSRRHRSDIWKSQQANNSRYLHMHLANVQGVSLDSDKTWRLTRGQGNVLTGHQNFISGDTQKHSNIFLKANGSHKGGAGRQHKEAVVLRVQELHIVTNNNGRKRQEEATETENWSSRAWGERRRGSNLRCRWLKVPYPVTDDCVCSC